MAKTTKAKCLRKPRKRTHYTDAEPIGENRQVALLECPLEGYSLIWTRGNVITPVHLTEEALEATAELLDRWRMKRGSRCPSKKR